MTHFDKTGAVHEVFSSTDAKLRIQTLRFLMFSYSVSFVNTQDPQQWNGAGTSIVRIKDLDKTVSAATRNAASDDDRLSGEE